MAEIFYDTVTGNAEKLMIFSEYLSFCVLILIEDMKLTYRTL